MTTDERDQLVVAVGSRGEPQPPADRRHGHGERKHGRWDVMTVKQETLRTRRAVHLAHVHAERHGPDHDRPVESGAVLAVKTKDFAFMNPGPVTAPRRPQTLKTPAPLPLRPTPGLERSTNRSWSSEVALPGR